MCQGVMPQHFGDTLAFTTIVIKHTSFSYDFGNCKLWKLHENEVFSYIACRQSENCARTRPAFVWYLEAAETTEEKSLKLLPEKCPCVTDSSLKL